jgi:hypothetical protein
MPSLRTTVIGRVDPRVKIVVPIAQTRFDSPA